MAASLGLGSIGLGAWIEPWKPYLTGLTVVFLALGFYFTYTKTPSKLNKSLVWFATIIFLLSLVYPYVQAGFLGGNDEEKQLVVNNDTKLVTVHVEGMT